MHLLIGALGAIWRGVRQLAGTIRAVDTFGGHVIADRVAMFGDDPANDPRRMDFDPNRPVDRRR